jgi:predicted MFS family arabinose efflux permease
MSSDPLPRSQTPLASPAFRLLLVAQATFGVAYSTFLILPKYLATHLGATPARVGWIMASAGLANVLWAPLMARFIARVGRRRALVAANHAHGGGVAGIPAAGLAGAAGLPVPGGQGMAWALMFSSAGALAIGLCAPERMSQAIALHGSANLLTNAIGPALAEPAMAAFGHAPVFLASGAVALAGALVAARVPAGGPPPPRAPAGRRSPPRAPLPRFLLFVSVVLGIACGTMFTFHQPLALARGMSRVSDFLVAYTVGAVAVRVGLGGLIDRVGPRRVAFGSFVLYGGVVAGMAGLAPGGLAVFGALFGLAHGVFFPAFMALSVQAVSAADRDRLLAWINATFNAGTVAVAGLGAVAERAGFAPVFIPVGVLVAATALGLRRTQGAAGRTRSSKLPLIPISRKGAAPEISPSETRLP